MNFESLFACSVVENELSYHCQITDKLQLIIYFFFFYLYQCVYLRFALISFKNPAATIVIALSTSTVICNIPWGGKILKKEAITAQPGKQLFFSFRTTKFIKRQKG